MVEDKTTVVMECVQISELLQSRNAAKESQLQVGNQLPADCSGPVALDLDAWKGDLQRLHGSINQSVQSFIANQTGQLDAVAAELASQKQRILLKERYFEELSASIAGFVEEESSKLEVWGVTLGSQQEDEQQQAYDAQLPGPEVLHRINRLWRKATKAFEGLQDAKAQEMQAALEEQRVQLQALVDNAEDRYQTLRRERDAEVSVLEARLEAMRGMDQQKDNTTTTLQEEVQHFRQQLEKAQGGLAEAAKRLEEAESARSRKEYEWGVERDELIRLRGEAEQQLDDLHHREQELSRKCSERGEKLEQMKRLMDDQERDMTVKIDRVQQYVKERQAGALNAEKKQQDAERTAERWQQEVRRLQAEKDKLAKMVLDLESRSSGQANVIRGNVERHQEEVSALQESLTRNEEKMRAANLELLRQRDEDYQNKIALERQREKDRSIGLLKKKEQELHIKDQQLRAARQRIQELEVMGGVMSDSGRLGASTFTQSSSPSSKGLPPLPLSAR